MSREKERSAAQAVGRRLETWGGFFAGSPLRLVAYLVLGTALSLILGLLSGKWLLPWWQGLIFYPLYAGVLSRNHWRLAWGCALAWASGIALGIGWASYWRPEWMEPRILMGAAYQAEMFRWIQTGLGREGDILAFLPEHGLHILAVALLTRVSAGFLGLVAGAVLVNYMSFYVGTLMLQATDPAWLACLAWPPWAILRVVGFVSIAVALSARSLSRAGLGAVDRERQWTYLAGGLALLVSDVVLKWLLAPLWREWLASLTAWS